jgi:hypothetical protein
MLTLDRPSRSIYIGDYDGSESTSNYHNPYPYNQTPPISYPREVVVQATVISHDTPPIQYVSVSSVASQPPPLYNYNGQQQQQLYPPVPQQVLSKNSLPVSFLLIYFPVFILFF